MTIGCSLRKVGQLVTVNDSFQTGYQYILTAGYGQDFDSAFRPFYSPQEMLSMGVFEGKYINDCQNEFPSAWYEHAKLADLANSALNYFGTKSRQPLSIWQEKGWIVEPDPRGWFQWYCRYYLGRRIPEVDRWQIKRWRAFTRHQAQVRKNCHTGDMFCRPRQRQALLQWSHDALI